MGRIDPSRWARRGIALAALLFGGMAGGRAEAQVFVGVTPYGPYWGWGNSQADQLENYLQQQGIERGRAASAQRNQALSAADNSNAYYNHVRDSADPGRYGTISRRRAEVDAARPSSSPPRETQPAPTPRRIARPLGDYFNRSDAFVWPADAPTDGDMASARGESDHAARGVLDEVRQYGSARVATVADARVKLLDYGRPALDALRQRTTPAIAELFHAFLLGLYDSLEQAATTPPAPRP